MRSVKYRVDVLRGNVPFSQMHFSSPPSIYMDAEAEIKLTMRGEFLKSEIADYIRDEIRPVMILDGIEYPLGVYRIGTVRETVNAAGVHRESIEAYDRAVMLSWAKTEQRDFWAAGTPYDNVIQHYLTAAGIIQAVVVPSAAVLQSDREDWDIGTSYLTIINTLLAEINYNSLWFDLTGTARVEPYTAPNATNIAHRYGAEDGVTVLRPEYASQVDVFAQPNVFIAILENPEYPEPLIATAVNDTPASRLSTISRGIRIPQVYKVDNIASAEELQTYVNRLRDESMQLSEIVEIQTANMPNHNAGDVIALTHPDLTGLFREISWSMTLQAGALMSHTIQRVVVI